jgi:hypothetical protein
MRKIVFFNIHAHFGEKCEERCQSQADGDRGKAMTKALEPEEGIQSGEQDIFIYGSISNEAGGSLDGKVRRGAIPGPGMGKSAWQRENNLITWQHQESRSVASLHRRHR